MSAVRPAAGFIVAAPESGAGKTTVTLALLAALRRRGLRVAPFKIGPDFIDPLFHARAAGVPSRTLDAWMLGAEALEALFRAAARDADLAVIEGMMGLFDGVSGSSDQGSTAAIAKRLDLPVVLVVDASAQARSVAALVSGFERFDPAVRVAGVIFNRVAGNGHYRILAEAMAGTCDSIALGWLGMDPRWAIPERHLGLATERARLPAPLLARLAAAAERTIDLDGLLALSGTRPGPRCPAIEPAPRAPRVERVPDGAPLLAVARDEAFTFYYEDNLDALRREGIALGFFSPLRDARLPRGARGVYLGGGYPELYARTLAANRPMRAALRLFAEAGGVIYAECGGLMALVEELRLADGKRYPMACVLPGEIEMRPRPLAIGYAEITTRRETPLGPAGEKARGHLFHASRITRMRRSIERAYHVEGPGLASHEEGYARWNVLASYVHLHFGSNPRLAANLARRIREADVHA